MCSSGQQAADSGQWITAGTIDERASLRHAGDTIGLGSCSVMLPTACCPLPAACYGGSSMRIALFSDVHGNLTALRAVLAALDRHRPLQMIVAAGDHVLAGPRPAETWDALQAAGCTCIMGNEDERLWDRSNA